MPFLYPALARICRCPLPAVSDNWPRIVAALEARGIRSDLVEVAAAATVAVETAGTFRPINEYGGEAYFTKLYEGRADLGNTRPGDGARYHGRGFIQITGRSNYRMYSHVAGCDLEAHPEKALEPEISAAILAAYFAQRNLPAAAAIRDWPKVRRLVNGGLNGWAPFKTCVDGLLEALGDRP